MVANSERSIVRSAISTVQNCRLKERGDEYKQLLKRLIESGESQISLTDPDSRAMLNNRRVEVCYNVQATVDSKHKLILDHEVINEGTDCNQLSEMARRAKGILGVKELEVLADKGYFAADQVKECLGNGITPYIPEPERTLSKVKNHRQPLFLESEFRYDREKDSYICPQGSELTFSKEG